MAEQDMVPAQLSDVGDQAELTNLITELAMAKVRLFVSSFVPSQHNVEADYVAAEANFTGYVAAVPTYSAIGVGVDGNAVSVSSRMFFQATDAVHPNQIGGAWVETAAGSLRWWFQFNPPVNLTQALSFLAITISFGFRGQIYCDVEY